MLNVKINKIRSVKQILNYWSLENSVNICYKNVDAGLLITFLAYHIISYSYQIFW
jgi:hypothetical protein